jgi:L-cystine uptake protein TcyP (sodium:dicarboxylate symporter family)
MLQCQTDPLASQALPLGAVDVIAIKPIVDIATVAANISRKIIAETQ